MQRFSRDTIINIISIYDNSAHSTLDRLLLRFDLDEIAPRSLSLRSLSNRCTKLCRHIFDNPDALSPNERNLTYELIEFIIESRERDFNNWFSSERPDIINSLSKDGYTIADGTLTSLLPDSINLPEKQDEIFTLLDTFEFSTSKGHLNQAIDAYTRSNWAGANGQLRTYVESLFDDFAYKLGTESNPTPTTNSHNRRLFLSQLNPPFFNPGLNEWLPGNTKDFIQGFWSRLHPTGSHPGLSDEEDCTFRLHLVLLTSHHFLRRLNSRITNG